MKSTSKNGTQRGKNKPACIFCAAGYRMPIIRTPAKGYRWTGKNFGDNTVRACRWHAKMYTDWLPMDPEERRQRRREMNAIIKAHFRREEDGKQ